MNKNQDFLREIPPISPEESFLVFDRVKKIFDFPLHYHAEVELNFISRGNGNKRIIGDHIGVIDDLELVLVGPYLPHYWDNYKCKNKRIREVTIQFSLDFFDQSFMKKKLHEPIRNLIDHSIRGILFSKETAEKLKDRILNLSKTKGFESFIEMMYILNDLAESENQTYLSSYSIEKETFDEKDRMKIIHDYVHGNYEKKIMLEDISNLVNMSIVTFNRFIKKRTGKTFINYLNEIRVGYAARCLIEKDKTVSEIAFDTGFNNIANFNKVFKAFHNSTPSNFKAKFNGIKKVH